MCKKKCGLCRTKKEHYVVGDLVQVKVSSKGKPRYLNAIVTKRCGKNIVIIRYNVGSKPIEVKIIEKYLFCLNKNKCPLV